MIILYLMMNDFVDVIIVKEFEMGRSLWIMDDPNLVSETLKQGLSEFEAKDRGQK